MFICKYMYVYVYIYTYVCIYIYIYICVYIERAREQESRIERARERERERERARDRESSAPPLTHGEIILGEICDMSDTCLEPWMLLTHRRPFVVVSRPRSWSRFPVLRAILWAFIAKS